MNDKSGLQPYYGCDLNVISIRESIAQYNEDLRGHCAQMKEIGDKINQLKNLEYELRMRECFRDRYTEVMEIRAIYLNRPKDGRRNASEKRTRYLEKMYARMAELGVTMLDLRNAMERKTGSL